MAYQSSLPTLSLPATMAVSNNRSMTTLDLATYHPLQTPIPISPQSGFPNSINHGIGSLNITESPIICGSFIDNNFNNTDQNIHSRCDNFRNRRFQNTSNFINSSHRIHQTLWNNNNNGNRDQLRSRHIQQMRQDSHNNTNEYDNQ